MIDAAAGVTSSDLAIAGSIWELGRAAVVAINKWDLLDDEAREKLELSFERLDELLATPGRVNVSALSGRGVEKLWGPIDQRARRLPPQARHRPAQPPVRGVHQEGVAAVARRRAVEALLRHPGLGGAADLHAVRQPRRCRGTTTTGATWRTACARSSICAGVPVRLVVRRRTE